MLTKSTTVLYRTTIFHVDRCCSSTKPPLLHSNTSVSFIAPPFLDSWVMSAVYSPLISLWMLRITSSARPRSFPSYNIVFKTALLDSHVVSQIWAWVIFRCENVGDARVLNDSSDNGLLLLLAVWDVLFSLAGKGYDRFQKSRLKSFLERILPRKSIKMDGQRLY